MIKININENCKVRLTDFGISVMKEHFSYMPDEKYLRKPDALGYYSFSVWELFQIFGPRIHLGMSETPFVENVICFN
jgi:hypothetical protein